MRQRQSINRCAEEEEEEEEVPVVAHQVPGILHYVEYKVEGYNPNTKMDSQNYPNKFGISENNTPSSRDPMAQTLTKTFRMPAVAPNAVIGTTKMQNQRGSTTPID